MKRTPSIRALGAVAALAAAVVLPVWQGGKAGAAGSSPCTGDLTAAGVPQLPGPPLRMGITPAGRAGAVGPAVPLTPIDRAKTLAALRRLRPHHGSFVLRLNRFFWSDGKRGIRHFHRLARLY